MVSPDLRRALRAARANGARFDDLAARFDISRTEAFRYTRDVHGCRTRQEAERRYSVRVAASLRGREYLTRRDGKFARAALKTLELVYDRGE